MTVARTPRLVDAFDDPRAWDAFVRAHADGHLFQTWPWGALQSGLGGDPRRIAAVDDHGLAGVVQWLLFDTGARRFAYVPRGPVCRPDEVDLATTLLHAALVAAHREGADFLRVEPQWPFTADRSEWLQTSGWVPTAQSIMLPRTILVDLRPDEATLWSGFRSNTRNRVRLAEKLGVEVYAGGAADVATFVRLAGQTAARHQLRRDARQYDLAWRHFGGTDDLRLFLARHEGVDIAGVMVFVCGANATYVWGASDDAPEARRLNPNQLLHWTAMRWARGRGCTTYDFHGIPDADEDVLEAEYGRQSGGTWNLYRFKRGFGGRVHRHLGTYDWRLRA